MIGRPTSRLGHDTVEPELTQADRIHEGVDPADGLVLVDPVIQALGKTGSSDCDLTLQQNAPSDSPRSCRGILPSAAFLHSQGHDQPVEAS
jgi:hypothetical protein